MAPSCQRPFPACIQNFRGRTLWHYSSPLSIPTWRMALSPARECKKKERRNNLKWYLLQTFESKDKKSCFLEKWNPIKFTRKSQKISENLKWHADENEIGEYWNRLSRKCSSNHRPPIFTVVQSISGCPAGVFGMDHRKASSHIFSFSDFLFFVHMQCFPLSSKKVDLPHFSLKSLKSFSLNITIQSVAAYLLSQPSEKK